MSLSVQIAIAFLADLLIGDPKNCPHPVNFIAHLARRLETILRKSFSNLKIAGILTTIIVVILSFLTVWTIVRGFSTIHPWLGWASSIFFIFTTLSVRSLFDESRPVLQYLKEPNLIKARESLSNIVGRDTSHLDQGEIVRATVETVAESTVDGIIAPLIFAVIGGAPLAMAYKAINTLDSLFGYKNDTYREFGWASARLDDLANWFPARLAMPIMAVSACLCGLSGKNSLTMAMRDGTKHPSPNSGFPEAAVAGALGVRLGGTSLYSGKINDKPFIGDNLRELELSDITLSHKIMFLSSALAVAAVISIEILQNF
ncbi:MAG: cobalamin biosynthesis protein CobD [Nitrospina sp.]|jgi:adenosylcobinamide-phosphate synthase|nr:cobalamin biosynthesis protein CobD [Nitrospina sp.]